MGGITIAGAAALVTGAGHGIGRATALALAERGADVVCADLDLAAAEKVAAAGEEAGGTARALALDVADRPAVLAAAEALDRPLDLLVNNAGVGLSGPFADTDLTDWDWILSVNLGGVLNCCHAFGRPMAAAGRGQIVNVSSGLGYTPRATESAYVTTKAAVLALSRSLRADWQPHGVGVTAICPGVIDTGIIGRTRFTAPDGEDDRRRAQQVFRRGHRPEAVAAAIVRAAERDRAVVPVGWESHLAWWFSRLGPVALQQRVARRRL